VVVGAVAPSAGQQEGDLPAAFVINFEERVGGDTSSRRSPEESCRRPGRRDVLAPYSAVDVREPGVDDGFEACLPASSVREYAVGRVDR
jgi:hypothetical protein